MAIIKSSKKNKNSYWVCGWSGCELSFTSNAGNKMMIGFTTCERNNHYIYIPYPRPSRHRPSTSGAGAGCGWFFPPSRLFFSRWFSSPSSGFPQRPRCARQDGLLKLANNSGIDRQNHGELRRDRLRSIRTRAHDCDLAGC